MSEAPSLLASRALTAEERAAHDEEPRPGVGREGEMLGQDQTDLRIRRELFTFARADEREELVEIMGRDSVAGFATCVEQRGGLDSDPMVRLLAYRAWGDRDRAWFATRGIQTGEAVTLTFEVMPSLYVGLAWPNERVLGTARTSAMPGQMIEVRLHDPSDEPFRDWPVELSGTGDFRDRGDHVGVLLVSDRPRTPSPPRSADVIAYPRYHNEYVAPVWTSAERVAAMYDECAHLVVRARGAASVAAMDEALRAIERLGGGDRWRTVRLLARMLAVPEQAMWGAYQAHAQRVGVRRRIVGASVDLSPPPPPERYRAVLEAFGIEIAPARAPGPSARPAARPRKPTLPMPTMAPRMTSIIDAMVAEARDEASQVPAPADDPESISLRPPSIAQRLRAWWRRT